MTQPAVPFRAVVVGEPGTGKTSLVSFLQTGTKQLQIGTNPRGVTKTVTAYEFDLAKQGRRTDLLIDGPGTGDMDVPLTKYVADLEALLQGLKLNAVLICEKMSEPRIRMGLQVVMKIIEKGFVEASGGSSVWDHIILVGTKKDRIEDPSEETNFREAFRRTIEQELKVPAGKSLAVCATGNCKAGRTPDIDQLYNAMRAVPKTEITYKAPDANQLADAFSKISGVKMQDKKKFEQEMNRQRQAHANQIKALNKKMEELKNRPPQQVHHHHGGGGGFGPLGIIGKLFGM